jgi:hypothetical protein
MIEGEEIKQFYDTNQTKIWIAFYKDCMLVGWKF